MGDNWSRPRPPEAPKSVFRTMLGMMKWAAQQEPAVQQALIRVLEEWGPKIEAAENGMTLVDDATIRAIVADQRHGIDPRSAMPPKKESGPPVVQVASSEPAKDTRNPQTKIFDNMVDALVGTANDTSKLR